MASDPSTPTILPLVCASCRYPGGGPSDHETWCPAFMVGPIDLENQLSLLDEPSRRDAR